MASYAAIAKGRSASGPSTKPSSAGASGTTTPATTSIPELVPGSNWADDVESKDSAQSASQTSTDASSVPSVQSKTNEQDKPESKSAEEQAPLSQVVEKDSGNVTASAGPADEERVASSQKDDKSVTDTKSETDNKEGEEEKAPAKPVYTEAKPPAVNIWAQRAAEAKAKAATQVANPPQSLPQPPSQQNDADRAKSDNRRRPEQNFGGRDYKRGDAPGRPRDDFRGGKGRREPRADEGVQRRAANKPRDRAASEVLPPPVSSEVAWPKPTDAVVEDEKKKVEEKDRVPSNGSKPHGKTVWEAVDYTPNAIFETRLEGKPSIRMGKGSGRSGPPGGVTRGTQQHPASANAQRPGVRVPSLPNGDHSKPDAAGLAARTDRETMPSPSARLQNDGDSTPNPVAVPVREASVAQTNGVSPAKEGTETGTVTTPTDQSDLNGRAAPFTRRTSPRQNDSHVRRPTNQDTPNRQSSGTQTNGALNTGMNGEPAVQTPRSTYSDRRSEPHLYDSAREPAPFREGKRGGRKGGRGAFNGTFASPNPYAQGYGEFQGSQMPLSPTGNFFPGRGGSHGGRGYRGALRSQSIPLDAFGRQAGGYPGYPMMQPMQPYMQDYYGPYSAGPYPAPPAGEREMQTMAARAQMEYYFSIDNLLKDIFLRKQMDSQGWIFLQVIAQFNRMKQMTTDYELLKSACLQSVEVEIRIGEDGKERVRKARDWEQWVLPKEDRDPAAQTDGPSNLRRPSPVRSHYEYPPAFPQSPGAMGNGARRGDNAFHIQDAATAPPFFPGAGDPRFGDFPPPVEESRGRQVKPSQHRDSTASPLTNGLGAAPAENAEPDRFPSSQIDELTVVVRKHDVSTRPSLHNANARTFSNGSIDSRNIMEEVMRSQQPPITNGTGASDRESPLSPVTTQAKVSEEEANNLSLFWVKDREAPVDVNGLPDGTTHELYTHLRSKALAQRDAAATGTCPYDLDVLYQFWSHFLIRNFNFQMYYEFKTLAAEDATQRHNDVGMANLVKFYSEALASQIAIRENVARDCADLLKLESNKAQRPAFKELNESWRNGSLNLKNRKKLGDFLDEKVKTELNA
ncbi:La-related protein 1 [Sphaceloma murrayae]|uniref:La-related protein 1 n=1 Tax=Sphaceloma murrayae TaxID=2082308 RepID=A0A2K1QVA8_9PEZI|nr:La-related protein 1 [Sphaceloma murrayae]